MKAASDGGSPPVQAASNDSTCRETSCQALLASNEPKIPTGGEGQGTVSFDSGAAKGGPIGPASLEPDGVGSSEFTLFSATQAHSVRNSLKFRYAFRPAILGWF